MSEEEIREMCDDIYQGGDWQPIIDYITDIQEKLKIATVMLTKGTYPEKNEGDNDFDKQFIAVDKIREIIDECIEKKANVITGKEEYCFNTNDNSFLAHKIVELVEEK